MADTAGKAVEAAIRELEIEMEEAPASWEGNDLRSIQSKKAEISAAWQTALSLIGELRQLEGGEKVEKTLRSQIDRCIIPMVGCLKKLRAAEALLSDHLVIQEEVPPIEKKPVDEGTSWAEEMESDPRAAQALIGCGYCGRMEHYSVECDVFSTMEEKRARIRTSELCYKCLSGGHLAFKCEARCKKCGKGHHESICRPPPAWPVTRQKYGERRRAERTTDRTDKSRRRVEQYREVERPRTFFSAIYRKEERELEEREERAREKRERDELERDEKEIKKKGLLASAYKRMKLGDDEGRTSSDEDAE